MKKTLKIFNNKSPPCCDTSRFCSTKRSSMEKQLMWSGVDRVLSEVHFAAPSLSPYSRPITDANVRIWWTWERCGRENDRSTQYAAILWMGTKTWMPPLAWFNDTASFVFPRCQLSLSYFGWCWWVLVKGWTTSLNFNYWERQQCNHALGEWRGSEADVQNRLIVTISVFLQS